jgi:hypothetical protein
MGDIADSHFQLVAKFIRKGSVVPFLGAGVNLSDRLPGDAFTPGHFLPSGSELGQQLAEAFFYSGDQNLARVSQYIAVKAGMGELYDHLHGVFDFDYAPTSLHRFLAAVPGVIRRQGFERYQLILTTNYDDALERAFDDLCEPYDLITYISEGAHRGKCRHVAPDGAVTIVERPNEYHAVSSETRTVIAKIHGAVDRGNADDDSFVITEDDYIDYLVSGTEITELLPTHIAAKLMGKTHFLFLGYGLRDWNLRVILRRIWGQQVLGETSWAVLDQVDEVDRAWWQRWGPMELEEVPLKDYVPRLQKALADPARAAARP